MLVGRFCSWVSFFWFHGLAVCWDIMSLVFLCFLIGSTCIFCVRSSFYLLLGCGLVGWLDLVGFFEGMRSCYGGVGAFSFVLLMAEG